MIGAPGYLDLPTEWLMPSLTGRVRREPAGADSRVEGFHLFDPAYGSPCPADAELLITQCMELLGRQLVTRQVHALTEQTARPDLFRESARYLGISDPPVDAASAPGSCA